VGVRIKTYRIETQHLVIRCYNPSDAQGLQESLKASREHLLPWMAWALFEPQPLSDKIDLLRTFRAKFDLGEDAIYGIFDKSETQVIGGTGLHPRVGNNAREIGYWVDVNHIGKGVATETTSALIKVGFEIENLSRIEIHCDPANVKSSRIPEKLGFKHEATLKARLENADGELCDKMVWTLFRDDYLGSSLAAMQLKAFDASGTQIVF
jgi:RimJ/RimL family protein N-acetyltransferase